MTVFRRFNLTVSEPAKEGPSQDDLSRLARRVGRLLLWSCVLLLLVRGALSMFSTPNPRVVTTTRGATVTVTQPAHSETSQARRK